MSDRAPADATKRQLTDSLKKLMRSKPLHKISIREITDGCGVNRQTFYYHFSDIYDQLRWMYQQEAIALLEKQEGVLLWQDGLLQLFHYLDENREICLCTIDSVGREHLHRFFYSDIYNLLHRTIDTLLKDFDVDEGYRSVLTQFYVCALSGMIENWLRGEIPYTPEELVHMADVTFQDHYNGALMRLSKEQPRQHDRSEPN